MKEYKLNSNSWHAKLMKCVWGWSPRSFMNMCPYFWLTVFNVVFIVPIIFFKILGFAYVNICKPIFNAIDTYCMDVEQRWYEKYTAQFQDDILSKKENKKLAEIMLRTWHYNHKTVSDKQYRLLTRATKNISPEEVDKYYREIVIPKTEKAKNSTMTSGQASVYAKKAVLIFGSLLGIAIIYGLYVLFGIIDWSKVLKGVIMFGQFAIAGAIVFAIGWAIIAIIKYLFCAFGSYCIPCQERREAIALFFIMLWTIIVFPFKYAWLGIVAVFDIIRDLKQNHCPGINWD